MSAMALMVSPVRPSVALLVGGLDLVMSDIGAPLVGETSETYVAACFWSVAAQGTDAGTRKNGFVFLVRFVGESVATRFTAERATAAAHDCVRDFVQ
ncbi:MAG: hypothetical protein M3O50_22630 [Myxococcota bacterium]|nr:hypothetical protein [Myxococcota bacterium]